MKDAVRSVSGSWLVIDRGVATGVTVAPAARQQIGKIIDRIGQGSPRTAYRARNGVDERLSMPAPWIAGPSDARPCGGGAK